MVIDMAQYMRDRRRKRKAALIDMCGGECMDCGSTERLEFDHVDPLTKVKEVSSAKMLDGPMARVLEEVAKCRLLCHDCHRLKTVRCGETGGGHNKIINPAHGTAAQYNWGCRCDDCKLWKRNYRNGLVDARNAPRVVA
jgi:5-methylcytosine-specific restriction endonuclease McrA